MNSIDTATGYELSRTFSISQAALFSAFVDVATLKEIWGVSDITVDARPGGETRATLTIGNESWDFTITYQEVVPNDRLRWFVRFYRRRRRTSLCHSALRQPVHK
jgi:uncharacterized protein YndB with AHSA1/START domain